MADGISVDDPTNQFRASLGERALEAMLRSPVVPSNARVLLDTMRGKTTPITEKDFSQEELNVLRSMYQQRKLKNEKNVNNLRRNLFVNEQDYLKNPETKIVFTEENGKQVGRPVQVPYAEYIRNVTNQINSYEKTKNKTSLGYYDYPDGMAAPTFDSWLGSVWKSYTDPAYRMKTILGSYNVFDTPEGRQVVDRYNFDKSDYYRSVYGIDPTKASIGEIFLRSNGPVDFLDMVMIKKFPTTSRNVNIRLGDGLESTAQSPLIPQQRR